MAKDFDLDLGPLIAALDHSPDAIYNGSKRAVQDILNDWQRETRDDAPIDTGELRRNIKTDMRGTTATTVQGRISGNVYNNGFNYGYWQHEIRNGGGLKYIENNAKPDEWRTQIQDEIKAELRKAGW